ncbi:MAG: hypothetical protein JEZ09_04665 [Salinivirgaceae bacterium]|nr:hypothetical protein [Salinivirgaceae bacterium]
MEKKKGLSIVLLIPAVIIGVALFKEFDFENLKFENPALAFVYFIGIVLSITFLIKDARKRPEK